MQTESARSNQSSLRETFRSNLCALMQRAGLSPTEVGRRARLPRHLLARWIRVGTERPKVEHLAAAANALGLDDPRRLFEPDLIQQLDDVTDETCTPIDRITNPFVEEVLRERPDLFRDFSPLEWRELYSLHGVGGPLSPEGVVEAARRIQVKRELRRKFESLLETEHFELIASLLNVLDRDTRIDESPSGEAA